MARMIGLQEEAQSLEKNQQGAASEIKTQSEDDQKIYSSNHSVEPSLSVLSLIFHVLTP